MQISGLIVHIYAFEDECQRPNHSTFNSFACGKSLNSKNVPSVRKASGVRSQFDHTRHQSCRLFSETTFNW